MTPGGDIFWSADRRTVTKRLAGPELPYSVLGRRERAFRNELRVNRLLLGKRPPVPTPRLVGFDVRAGRMALVDVPGGRDLARSYVPVHQRWSFLVSAILVHLLHLHIWTEVGRHHETRTGHEATTVGLLRELARG